MSVEHDPAREPEAIFAMDPTATLVSLARFFVKGQRGLADSGRALDGLPPQIAGLVGGGQFDAPYQSLKDQWHHQTMPMLAASMRLALEVLDTFGPGHTVIDDPTEAAIWNNKHHVWVREMTPPDADAP